MEDHRKAERAGRGPTLVRRMVTVALAATLVLAMSPVAAAHADTWRTASATGWGPSPSAGSANAQANARAALAAQAAQFGEVCTNVTSSATRVYTAPDGSAYIYNATASGYCAPAPPPPSYTVARSATRQGGGSNSTAAVQNGAQAAQAAILAVGMNCTGWTTSSSHVYTAPDGSWYIFDVTVNALCTN